MSVYDCEPPQLDLPPIDEEISRRREHENDFDLDDDELSSYSMNLNNEHSTITSNVLHLYDSSPPPVDDYFIRKNDYVDNLEIPPDDNEQCNVESAEKSIINDDEDFNQIDMPSIPTVHYTSPKNDEIFTDKVEENSSIVENTETISMSKLDEMDVGVITFNEGPIHDDSLVFKDADFNITLEDLPEDNEDENDKTNLTVDYKQQECSTYNNDSFEKIDNDFDVDDDFDNFNDFEQAIPLDRHIESQIVTENEGKQDEPNEIQFEADFSNAFEVNFDNNDFQNFNSDDQEKIDIKHEHSVTAHEKFNDDEEDDDFGDFNDFTQAAPEVSSIAMPKDTLHASTLTILNDSEVKSILDEMFPVNLQHNDENITYTATCKEDDVKIVNDVESTLALTYEYKDSSTNHILIKALGIDERNILYGQQWGSSNMPRFASDLSFNPLEPAKFSSSSTSSFNKSNSSSANNNNSIVIKAKEIDNPRDFSQHQQSQQPPQQPDIVPEFDWNVAGLINPLDAHNNYLLGLEHLNQIPSYSRTTNNNTDVLRQFDSLDSNKYVNKKRNSKQTNTLKTNEREKEESSIQNDLSVFESIPQKNTEVFSSDVDMSKHLWQNERFDVTNNTVVRERTIKLPETHIFTPIKSISPVACEVSRESSPIREKEKDKRSVIIKEYHDVEYSLEPSKKSDNNDSDFGDFNDFQSAVTNSVSSNLPTALLPTTTSILAPQKTNESNTKLSEITNPIIDDFEPFVTNVINVPNPSIKASTKYDVFSDLSKASTENNKSIEDDFADFQAAPTITVPPILQQKSVIEKVNSNYKEDSSITLSPSRLVNNMKSLPEASQHKMSAWNDKLDSDEISRIEAAFPKCKIDSNKKSTHQFVEANPTAKDDDEWCDFQSVSQSSNFISSVSNNTANLIPNHSSSMITVDSKKIISDNNSSSDTSDWSDFVSVPIAKQSINASQFLSKPNFSSWNQPIGKPFVNHTTSFLSSNNNYPPNSHYDDSFYTSMSDNSRRSKQPMTITNNFNYNNFERQDISTTVPPYQMSNGISTILPDLQFALPKTLINLSRGNGSDTTKK